MSVVPLTTDGNSPTIVTNQTNFDLNGCAILCLNLDMKQLKKDSNDSNVSYDLRVGKKYQDHREDGGITLKKGDPIKISPGMAVIIETEESIHVPKAVFGQISPKVSLLQMGISNTHSKIDPGYQGPLLVTVFNLGRKVVHLKRGDKFCSMFFVAVGDGVRPYNKPSKSISGKTGGRYIQRFLDFIRGFSAEVTLILLVVSTLALIASTIALFR